MTKIPQKVAKYYLSEVAQSGHTGSQNVLYRNHKRRVKRNSNERKLSWRRQKIVVAQKSLFSNVLFARWIFQTGWSVSYKRVNPFFLFSSFLLKSLTDVIDDVDVNFWQENISIFKIVFSSFCCLRNKRRVFVFQKKDKNLNSFISLLSDGFCRSCGILQKISNVTLSDPSQSEML